MLNKYTPKVTDRPADLHIIAAGNVHHYKSYSIGHSAGCTHEAGLLRLLVGGPRICLSLSSITLGNASEQAAPLSIVVI